MSTDSPTPLRRSRRKISLAKRIYEDESPIVVVRSLPAESLYLVIKQEGLTSATDLIHMASFEQVRLLLDFDLWNKDRFNEENFWDWLSLPDADDSLDILAKVLRACDLKLLGILVNKYVEVVILEEATSAPPDVGFITPDNGASWIKVTIENETHGFLLSRFLAFIFASSPEIYYQILAIPGVATASMLEEEAHQEKSGRLLGEGFPSEEHMHHIHQPMSLAELQDRLVRSEHYQNVEVNAKVVVEPLLSQSTNLPPLLASIREALDDATQFEQEYTLIANAALCFFGVPIFEIEEVERLLIKIHGAIEIGLESLLATEQVAEGNFSTSSLYDSIGLQPLYAHGLMRIMQLQRLASRIPTDRREGVLAEDPEGYLYLEGAFKRFPEVPSATEGDRPSSAVITPILEPIYSGIDLKRSMSFIERIVSQM